MTSAAISPDNLASYTIKDGLTVTERFFDLPLDYSDPSKGKIKVFARHMIPTEKAKKKEAEDLPFMVYLQGGPGFEVALQGSSGLAGELHGRGYQTLWLDQRGTGLSSAISHETLPSYLESDKDKAEYLKHFRADNIVKDCEAIRQILLGHNANPEDQKWSIIGQSFGGFCAITYLSFHSEGLKEVFLTGGLAPLISSPDECYSATLKHVIKRNEVYYKKYPRDIQRIRDIAAYLSSNTVTLPSGGTLSVRRFQQLGIDLGMSGGIDRIHQLVFKMSADLEVSKKLSFKALQDVERRQSFDGNPLYSILHEPIYCQGQAANWSASRALAHHSALFEWSEVTNTSNSVPLYFTGEMIFPETIEDYSNLKPLKGVADLLANDSSWGPLYDMEQLARNEVKVSAVTYVEDMYVDFELAQETASHIKNVEQHITNRFFHNGLRADSKEIMTRLFELSKREYD